MNKIKLGDVVEIISGFAFDSKLFNDSNGMPLIRIRDVKRGYTETFTTEAFDTKFIVKKDDILIGMDGEFNLEKWMSEDALLNQRVCKLIPNENIDKNYIYFFLPKKLKEIENKTSFATVKHISIKQIENIEINQIDITKQKEISKRLLNIKNIIKNKKIQLELLTELIKSQFVEFFGDVSVNNKNYKKVKLSEISEYWNGLTYKPTDVVKDGVIVLRSSNIQNGKLDFKDIVKVNCKIADKKFVKDKDILMCSRNGSARLVGKVALIDELTEPMSFGAFMMIIRSKYYPYLFSYFETDAFRNQISTGATTTINQITSNMMNRIELPLPPENEINEFERIVKLIDKQKFEIEKSLKEMEELYDSLMEKYFG